MKITLAATVLFSAIGTVYSATRKEAIITCAKTGSKFPCITAIGGGNTRYTIKEKQGGRIENPDVEFYITGEDSCRGINTAIPSFPSCRGCFVRQIAGVSTCVDEK